MNQHPIRRSQLITPNGVGSLFVLRDGTTVIAAGLDHWYRREDGTGTSDATAEISEYMVEEWRLKRLLHVDHFRLPPDYRAPRRGVEKTNIALTMPYLRFPTWHTCPFCHHMAPLPLTAKGRQACIKCQEKAKYRPPALVQMPVVAVCDHGHLQDIPWREWVHKEAKPRCTGELKLLASGAAGLGGQRVICSCGASLTMARVLQPGGVEDSEGGVLGLCQGKRPWLGEGADEACGRLLNVTQTSASNTYFPKPKTAIYLPRGSGKAVAELVALLEQPSVAVPLSLLLQSTIPPEQTVPFLRAQIGNLLASYTDTEIAEAVRLKASDATPATEEDEADDELTFRQDEYEVLRTPKDDRQLTITQKPLEAYSPLIQRYFARVMRVSRLRETRVLVGFSRAFPENDLDLRRSKAQLRKHSLPPAEDWLPVNVVFGEGLFLEFNAELLARWEARPEVQARARKLHKRYEQAQQERRLRELDIPPRLVLIHSFAHAFMNQLTFECGYSAASLRERLYASADPERPMAGVLIYTAAGDAEGTLGGLVRMGKPGLLEPVIQRALEDAAWCSADPICSEMGERGGQGPDSCNLAACHACSLVPETSCEYFNRFLDRGLLVDDCPGGSPGFFSRFVGSMNDPVVAKK